MQVQQEPEKEPIRMEQAEKGKPRKEKTINPDETPQGVVDLDEGETPKGDGSDAVKETGKKSLPLAAGNRNRRGRTCGSLYHSCLDPEVPQIDSERIHSIETK